MTSRRRLQFVQGQVAWMLAAVVVLATVGSLSLELFFVLSLIGFLVGVELTAPVAVTPTWRRRLWWFVAASLLVFGYVAVRRILEILPEGVL